MYYYFQLGIKSVNISQKHIYSDECGMHIHADPATYNKTNGHASIWLIAQCSCISHLLIPKANTT